MTMTTPPSRIILEVERAADDLRRGAPVIMRMRDGSEIKAMPGEYAAGHHPAIHPLHPALSLMKIAGLLPQAILGGASEQDRREWLSVSEEAVLQYRASLAAALEKVSEAGVPLREAPDARVIAFRPRMGHEEHLAIIVGDIKSVSAPYVRVHSSCITGDVMGSLRCDCGDQLQKALHVIADQKAGVIVYLNQEGRGIGIASKLRAYALQDRGADTVEANEQLGYAPDERDFLIAGEMLKQLGIEKVTLLTNNPAKADALQAAGVKVEKCEPLRIEPTTHNRKYLSTKAQKLGHHLSDTE